MLIRLLLVFTIFVAGCASRESAGNSFDLNSPSWSGRFALTTEGEDRHNTSASFNLRGNAERGELIIFSPIGSTVAVMNWTPERAVFESNGHTELHADLGALTQRLTGTRLPVAAFFSWFEGRAVEAEGWTVNLDKLGEGRISALRALPPPKASVRIVLDH